MLRKGQLVLSCTAICHRQCRLLCECTTDSYKQASTVHTNTLTYIQDATKKPGMINKFTLTQSTNFFDPGALQKLQNTAITRQPQCLRTSCYTVSTPNDDFHVSVMLCELLKCYTKLLSAIFQCYLP